MSLLHFRYLKHCMRCWFACLILTIASLMPLSTKANESDLLAYRLFQQGDYSRAAELFTDPVWKGVALYRSEQWWRAAEAFIRADNAVSVYNLGNCYVRLGYHELALDAYLQALEFDPSLESALHNADLMRELLAMPESEQATSARQGAATPIEQLDSDKPPSDSTEAVGGKDAPQPPDVAIGEDPGDTDQSEQQSEGSARSDDSKQEGQSETSSNDQHGRVELRGSNDQSNEEWQASGGSESALQAEDSQAAGQRTKLEREQATTQWLNRIQHDTDLFLQRRIQSESRLRREAGQSPPAGGSSW